MKEAISAMGQTVHLMAAVTWIGGIIFILLVAIPSSKQVLGDDAGSLMAEVSKRFTPLANLSIFMLVTTGIALSVVSHNWTNVWPKAMVAIAMVAIHFYRGLAVAPKIAAAKSAAQKLALQKLSLKLVKVNLALGITVLFLSTAA